MQQLHINSFACHRYNIILSTESVSKLHTLDRHHEP